MPSFKKPVACHCSRKAKKGNCLCNNINKCLESIGTEIRTPQHILGTSSQRLRDDSESGSHVAQKKRFKKFSKRSHESFQNCSCRVKRTEKNIGAIKQNESKEIAKSAFQVNGDIAWNEKRKAIELNVNCTLLLNKTSETLLKVNQNLSNSKGYEDQNLRKGFDPHNFKEEDNDYNSNNFANPLIKRKKIIASFSDRDNSKDARDFLQNTRPLIERTIMSSYKSRDTSNEHLLKSEISTGNQNKKNCCTDSPNVLHVKQEKLNDYYQSPSDGSFQYIKYSSKNVNNFHIAPQPVELKSEKCRTDFAASSLQDMEIKSQQNLLKPYENLVAVKQETDINLNIKEKYLDGMNVYVKTEPVENEICLERNDETNLFSSKQSDNHVKSERCFNKEESLDEVEKWTNNYAAVKENNTSKLSIKKEKDETSYDAGSTIAKFIRKQNCISEVKNEYDTDDEIPIHDTVDDYFDFDNRVNDVDEKELHSRIIWPEAPDEEYKNIFQDPHASQTVFRAEDCLHHSSISSSTIGGNLDSKKNNEDTESKTMENETKEQSTSNNDSVRSKQLNVELLELFMSENIISSHLPRVPLPRARNYHNSLHQFPVNCPLSNINMANGKHSDNKEFVKSESPDVKVEESSSNDDTIGTRHSDNMPMELINQSVPECSYTYISQAAFPNEDHSCHLPLDSLTESNVFDKKIDTFDVVSESMKGGSVSDFELDSSKQIGLSIRRPLDDKCFIHENALSEKNNINVNGRAVRSEGAITDVCKSKPNSEVRKTKHKLKPNNSSSAKKLKLSLKESIECKVQCPNELPLVIKIGTCGLERIPSDELKSNNYNTQTLNIKSPVESKSASLKKSKSEVVCTKTQIIRKSKKLTKITPVSGPSLHCNSNIENCSLEGTPDQRREDPLRNYKIPKRKVTKKEEIPLKTISFSSKDEPKLPVLRNDVASKLKVTDSNISFENGEQKVLPLPQQENLIGNNIPLSGNNDKTKPCQSNNDQNTQRRRVKSGSEGKVCVSKRALPTLKQRDCVNRDERNNLNFLANEISEAKKSNRRGIKPRQVKSSKKLDMAPTKKLLLPIPSKPTLFKCRSPKKNDILSISIQRPSNTRNYVSPENFIATIVNWNTSWLQEQQQNTTPPPVVDFSLMDNDKETYFKLTLFNLWNSVSESWQNYAAKDIEFAIIRVQPFQDITLLTCQTVIAANSSEVVIRDGHLTVIEALFSSRDETVYTHRMFGYVCHYKKENYSVRSAHPLLQGCILTATHSCQLVNFVIITKRRKDDVKFSKPMKLKIIKCIRASLGHCESLQNMHHCTRSKWTFTPQLKLCLLDEESSLNSSTPYNDTQKHAVLDISSAMFHSREPRLLLLFGQPGTGKTHTVMGIIQQLLFLQRRRNRVKILIASPSASALEEIGFRLLKLNSVLMSSWRRSKGVQFVFLGQKDNDLKNWSIDEQVKLRLKTLAPEQEIAKAFQDLNKKINVLKQELPNFESNSRDSVFKKKSEELDNAIENIDFFQRHLGVIEYVGNEDQEKRLRTDILRKANVILTTMTCLRHDASRYFNEVPLNFTCCIIDEAPHCTEPEILIPLQHGINKVLLVGSTNDVPCNVLPEKLAKRGFLFSFFEKVNKHFKDSSGRNPIFLLTRQHRMHPEICSYPSALSYFGHIKSGHSNEHFADFPFQPYHILNITDFHNNALDLENFLKFFCSEFLRTLPSSYTMGIITTDEKQKEDFKNYFDCTISLKLTELEVNTIEGFQGREFDVIVVSCIKQSTDSSSVGFMHDTEKLNIAITRARHSLIICGHLESLRTNHNWDALIKDAEARKLIFPVNSITVKQASEFVKNKAT